MHGALTFAEAFRGIVCHLCLALALGLIAVTVIASLAKAVAAPLRRLLGGGIVRIALAVAMVWTGIVESFSKHTNDPPRSVASPLPSVTPEDISNGWRVTETREGNVFSRPQDGACAIHEPWLVRGGFGDVARISADGWFFPWRDGFADGLTVFSDGEIRPVLRASYFPRPFDVPLSVVPAFNWHLLPGCASNVFWHASTPSNSIVIAWENAPVNRDANSLTNFQAEFFADGRFEYRYDDRAFDYVPVFPFDWDNDGLENSVDPEPLVAGPDAHGTNAEWYNTVCSNVFEAVAGGGYGVPALPWREGVNSNAYYFVDVVAERGPAPIRFTGDRESRLGNPAVVARAGETNHVPLLIGVDYAVTSDTPFSVSFLADYMYVEVETNEPCVARIRWPMDFQFTESIGASNRTYAVTVVPYDPGGEFSWGEGGGEPMRGEPRRDGGCSCVSYDGHGVVFGCTEQCSCAGICAAIGTYSFEDASFPFTGGECRCGFDDPEEPEGPTEHVATDGASLSIEFSKDAVIFEDAYQDSDGRFVDKRSTRVRLTVSAYGGTQGGSLVLGVQNLDKLSAVAGGQIDLPPTLELAAQQAFYTTCVYEAAVGDNTNDISVAGYFIENGTGYRIDREAVLTAVQLVVAPERPFPPGYPNRHTFGVCEKMSITPFPEDLSGFSWDTSGGVSNAPSNRGMQMFQHLLDEGACAVTFTYRSVSYTVHTMCLRPHDVVCRSQPEILLYGLQPGQAGGIGMQLELTLLPDTVRFEGIRVMERIAIGTPTGYFAQEYYRPWWNHGTEQGALTPRTVDQWNNFGDAPATEDECPQYQTGGWSAGTIIWPITTAWREPSDFSETEGWINFTVKEQKATIDAAGTVGEEKFGWRVERDVQGHANIIQQTQGGSRP